MQNVITTLIIRNINIVFFNIACKRDTICIFVSLTDILLRKYIFQRFQDSHLFKCYNGKLFTCFVVLRRAICTMRTILTNLIFTKLQMSSFSLRKLEELARNAEVLIYLKNKTLINDQYNALFNFNCSVFKHGNMLIIVAMYAKDQYI